MTLNTSGNIYIKFSTILLAAIFAAVALFSAGSGSAKASSPEYTNWDEYPTNPVFDPTERVYYPSVLFDGTTYRVWYDDGTGTRYSTSSDGVNWAAGTPVTGLTNGRHAVIKYNGSKYLIWYWDSSQLYSINAIRTAESNNGITWTLDAAITQVGTTVITGVWPNWNTGSYGPCEVFYNSGGSGTIVTPVDTSTVWQNKFVMYYDGTTGGYEDIGVAVSADGKQWQGYNGGAVAVLPHGAVADWDSVYATFCSVQKIDGIYHMWYSGGQAASNEGIGYAQSTDGLSWTKDAANPMMHMTDGIIWRSARTYTPRVIYDPSGFSGAGEFAYLKMWYNGTAGSNYAMGYAKIPVPPVVPGTTVGGRVNPVNKTAVLAPYLGMIVAAAAMIIIGRRLVLKFATTRAKRDE